MTAVIEVSARPGSGTAAQVGEAARECLSFRLGDEEYGIDILRVQEIRGYEAPTRIVGAPPFVRGVLNLRGVVVPIVDLRLRFGLDEKFDAATVTVVLTLGGRTIGAVVDAVSDVLRLAGSQIKPAPEFSGVVDASTIDGIATIGDAAHPRMLILMDIERLMSGSDIGLVEHAAH
ncbi:MAG: chemotaxis protein CheW [Burkholderiaceae bacterium]